MRLETVVEGGNLDPIEPGLARGLGAGLLVEHDRPILHVRGEHLAAVKPDGLFLILELMHFASEILGADVLQNGSNAAVTDKELKMAQALIETMSVTWEPEKYRDEYRTALMEIIEQKAQHKEIAPKAPSAPTPTNVVDLVKVLQDSLNRSQAAQQKRSPARDARRSTSALVRQKRRAGALG